MKNIAIFSDGACKESDKGYVTNVYKLYKAIKRRTPEQVAFYDPGVGADMLGYNNRTVKNALDSISNISIKAMSDNDQYNAWPQGKVFSHQSRAFCLYNVGKSHSGDPLAVYQQISDDGVTWTRTAPRIVATASELATWPQGISAWGAGSDGTNIWVAARFRKSSDESVSKIVLYKSTDGGSSYTKVLDPVPLYDTTTGKAPVLLHSFAVLPNGNIAFGYHFYDGEVGIGMLGAAGV